MEKEIEPSTNLLSIYHLVTSLTGEPLSVFLNIDKETFGIACFAVFSIIGASSYMIHKLTDSKTEPLHLNGLTKVKKLDRHTKQTSTSDKTDYHRILNELHDACNNCSNIFSSMKCVQLSSSYPELINTKLFSDGITPFHRVCVHGNQPLIEFMLAKGADPELKTIAGENALCMTLYYYLYSESENLNCLNMLYERGFYLRRDDEWYEIFLNLSIKNNNKSLTKWLLSHSKSKTDKQGFRASSAPL